MYELGDMLTPLLLLITFFFFFNDTATTEIYTLSLHDALPISRDILVCEQEGDRITHDIIHRLNQTFVTPIDREDILELVDRKSTRLNSSHANISYAVFCLKKKNNQYVQICLH